MLQNKVHDEGHEVACHLYSHPQLNTLSTDELQSEMNKANKANKAIFKGYRRLASQYPSSLWRY